ncbi:MAG: peptidoglycan-binding protein [Chthoniobacterales bacterium]|nr:peptidoglycan-binding protein [Chthoniobacterales bacterium]
MRRFLFFLVVLTLSGLSSMRADENVKAAQGRLKESGFYFGNVSGVYDDATAAAVTRYQIRHGLAISGKLDAATAQALGVAASAGETEALPTSGTWRRLRNGDMQFLQKLNAGAIPPPRASVASSPQSTSAPPTHQPAMEPHAPPPRLTEEETPSPGLTPQSPAEPNRPLPAKADYGTERLRDYVGAFVLAGLDPKIGAELEFFADRVEYFGESNVGRKTIQRDLLRYDRKWPERHFWLAGELKVEPQSGGQLSVAFPLRYELRSGSKHGSGQVMKRLTLQKTADGDLQIVAVNEKKTGRRQ